MEGVSVIICCYNSAKRLPMTLAYLSKQQVPAHVAWEVIIVNNNSTDNTADVAHQEWSKLRNYVPIYIVNEQKSGLSYARTKGVETAKYEYITFCDDDNWLFENYINDVFQFFRNQVNVQVGIIGGLGMPVFETDSPEWFNRFESAYAVGKQAETSGDVTEARGFVYGAGLALRNSVLKKLYSLGFKSLLTDRKGESLSSGGDSEICLAVGLLGYRVHYSEELKFWHFLPKERLTETYYYTLNKAFAQSWVILKLYALEVSQLQKKWFWFREILYFIRTDFLRSIWKIIFFPRMTAEHIHYHNKLKYYYHLLTNRALFNAACKEIARLKNDALNQV